MLPLAMRLLVLLLPLGQAAPKDGTVRPDPDPQQQQQPLRNPFQPGQEQLRLLQNYLQGLEKMEEEPEHMNREQGEELGPGASGWGVGGSGRQSQDRSPAIRCLLPPPPVPRAPSDPASFSPLVLLYLFALHDYDQSGQLDGLELLSMLTAALAPGAADFPFGNPVILVVDKVLETQDLNGDGLMTPAELINFPGEAPSHAEPKEPLGSPDVGRQSLLAKSSSRQETQEALGPRGEDGGQGEARRESLETVQEAGGQAEAEREAPAPGAQAIGQAEARDTGKEAEGLPGGAPESKNTPNEVEVHAVQLENDEI
uniref:Cell growth regulator with EF hand domain protein 1 n=1 Tax=Suricata suricatta TaxID=37032 RepID=A0A673UE53_SURSU